MNKCEADILKVIVQDKYINQRTLSEYSGYSLGVVNKSIKSLINQGYIDENVVITRKASEFVRANSPKNAIILAAGYGMRMVPINTQSPKALLEIKGETIIEHTIKQLHEVGIHEIYVVVGFMKEQFEYLIDEYGVELIVNDEYASKNNLHSLALACKHLCNTYIVPSDVWLNENLFGRYELYSWYMLSNEKTFDSNVRNNRKSEIVLTSSGMPGNKMIGVSYLDKDTSDFVIQRLMEYDLDNKYNNSFWESVLLEDSKYVVYAKCDDSAVEINTYEQLREIDSNSANLQSNALDVIAKTLVVDVKEIKNISVLKKGMTNRSFMFSVKNKRYIMRVPGEGTENLINRQQEAEVYRVINDKRICDNIAYINPKNGYKITEFIENSRVCDAENENDLVQCMKKLREFHKMKLKVDHEFNIFKSIDFYESLWNGNSSIYKDYIITKNNVLELKKYIDENIAEKVLTHIDAVPDNFLFNENGDIRLIDWEYAGMQDPHVDIAMFCIYAMYDRPQIDHLIDIYFENQCDKKTRLKIYCYISACGLLWSNWCEYKRSLGVEFGEYSIKQYRYAKEYYRIFQKEVNEDA